MALGYLMGALGHHLFPNRATSDGCANVYYYICWAISYPSMSASNLLWLKLDGSRAVSTRVMSEGGKYDYGVRPEEVAAAYTFNATSGEVIASGRNCTRCYHARRS